jgi:hypothetical protein
MTVGLGNPGVPVVIKSGSGPGGVKQSKNGASNASGKTGQWQPASPISFVLDDGSQERSIGWNDGTFAYPAVWLNRFTPPAGSYPLTLNQISIQFPDPTSAGIDLSGLSVDLLVYLDTDGDNNPANATKLAQLHTTVTVADGTTFSNYPVNIAVPGPGDIYIGFSDTYNSGGFLLNNYPAPQDTNGSQVRSWVAADGTNDPDYNNLGNNSTLSTIDSLGYAGNWVIRASGTTQCGP